MAAINFGFRVEESGEAVREQLAIEEWLAALLAVLESVKTRRVPFPGSRAYLDFVQDFIARASRK